MALKNGQISLETGFQKGKSLTPVRGVKHPEKLAPFETGLPNGGLLLQCRILVHF